MGKRLSELFVAKSRTPSSPRPTAVSHAFAARTDTVALDAGVLASFGTAAFVGVLAIGLKASENLSATAAQPQRAPEPATARADLGRTIEIPLAEVEEPAFARPIAYHPPATRPDGVSTDFPSLPPQAMSHETPPAALPDPLTQFYAQDEAEEPMVSTVAYVAPQIDIRRPRFGDGETVLAVATRRAPLEQSGLSDAADAFIEDVSVTWQAPRSRDVSLFVSSGDEAISWSFSEASPNHGALAYQEERVEVGEAAAGIALSLDSTQVALAHVQTQDVSFWGQRQEEDYSGVILTMKF